RPERGRGNRRGRAREARGGGRPPRQDPGGAGAAQGGGVIVFVAGASGVIGQRLLPLLRQDGHQVFGTTRSPAKADVLRSLGAAPLVVDVFDKAALEQAVRAAKPAVIIHQLTDLPDVRDPAKAAAEAEGNARLRRD